MNAADIAAIATAGLTGIGMLGSLAALAFKIGTLNGQLQAFMATSERDRSDILKDIGRLEERYERHTENHHGSLK